MSGNRVRWTRTVAIAGAVAACHGAPATRRLTGPAVVRTITQGGLDSLPRLAITDGHLVCLADGQNPCPIQLATANWAHDGKFATWEPNRPVQVWSPNDPNPMSVGEVGDAPNQYRMVASAAADGRGYDVVDGAGNYLLRFNSKGQFESSVPIPPSRMTRATGFAGDIPLMQLILAAAADSPAVFEVREIAAPGDTLGRTVVSLRLPWLRIRDGRPIRELPLFPVLPSYAIAPDSDVVWTAGDLFNVRRQTATGTLQWSLTSDAPGPLVTSDEIARMRAQFASTADSAARARFDSSAAVSGKYHPAITGILLAHDDRVLLVGPPIPGRDSLDFYALSDTGMPTGRFALPVRSRVLLFAGDSLLVQRPGANVQQELHWLRIGSPGAPPHS